ncbi:MAG: response regulator transcription factor [Candidatus Melainabacteria bacterium]|nr:response regulator transcription factor [Candidatus Melainabacteria bacterium]
MRETTETTKTRILIVEDDPDFASILRRALEQDQEFEIVDVIDHEQAAMARIKSTGLKDINCVLLDLQLPYLHGDKTVNSMAGLQILEELRHQQRFYGTIIVLTNSKSPADGERALAGGCDGYLCKRARISDIPSMLAELKMAIRGDVILVASQMRHVFIREDISPKEARLLDLLSQDKGWPEIARELGYKTPKAAANIGDRIFDKLLTPQDQQDLTSEGIKKREKALEIWRSRKPSHG